MIEQFSEWLIIKGYSPKTTQTFCHTTQRFLTWLEQENIEPENASYHDILAYVHYLKHRGNKQRTQQMAIGMIKQFYNFLQSQEAVSENPASIVEIKGIRRKELVEILTPEELEAIYQNFDAGTRVYEKHLPPQGRNELARKRNKIILGLIIYQGLRTEELGKLEIQDLALREGRINIQGARKYDARKLTLEAHQVYDLMDYIHTTRKEILAATSKTGNKVFVSIGTSLNFNNIMQKLTKAIQARNKKVKDVKQIRTSVIANWLKVHNLRKVQYMAGHRYVSSTESYQLNNIEELQEDIKKYHPLA